MMCVVIGVIYRFIDMIVVFKNLFNFCASFIIFVIVLEDVTIARAMPAFLFTVAVAVVFVIAFGCVGQAEFGLFTLTCVVLPIRGVCRVLVVGIIIAAIGRGVVTGLSGLDRNSFEFLVSLLVLGLLLVGTCLKEVQLLVFLRIVLAVATWSAYIVSFGRLLAVRLESVKDFTVCAIMGRVDLMILAVVFLFLFVARALFALFESFLFLKFRVSDPLVAAAFRA
jgi:hypothetical protein